MRTTILCLLLSAVAISADLLSDLDDIGRHFPIEKLEYIGEQQLAVIPEIRPALEHLQSLSNEEIYKQYVSQDLIDYFNRRGIDAESLFLHLIEVTKEFHRKLLEKQPSDQIESDVPSLTFADFKQMIVSSDALPVIRQKLETSPEFANFVAAITDPEFKALFYRKMNSGLAAGACTDCKDAQVRGWFSNAWKKIKQHGFGVGVSIPLGK